MKRLAIALLLALAACRPDPDSIAVSSRPETAIAARTGSFALQAGDLALVTAQPLDGAEDMKVCTEGATSDPRIARVVRVHDDCHAFVVTGEGPGTATIRFTARGTTRAVRIDVTQ